jgi:acyl-CoA synthetase (AMP-forming)/AMP-acid ligase II
MHTPDIGLANWFLQRALRTPERAALAFEGATWCYSQMQQRIEQLAGRLHGLGVQRGDRVAFLGLNQPMFLFAMFATARLGGIFVPLNFRLTGPEVAINVGDAEASVLIADAQHRTLIDAVRADLVSVRHFLSEDAAPRWQPTDDGRQVATDPVRVEPDDVAMIMYTSGTTGRAKGAMLTHGNFWWNNANAMHNFDVLSTDVTLAAAPLFHIGGLNVDVGPMDADGFLTICDRVKDMIISGGENIYPAEVENIVYEHPAIAEAAVIGVPDEKWGETVCAIAVLRPGQSLDLERLREFAGAQLARYKLPRRLEIVAALPRNATGKILKMELRKQFKQ